MKTQTGNTVTIEYDDSIVRLFLLASLITSVVAMLVGVIISSQLHTWQMNGLGTAGLEWITFGRLRPLHTNAAIFAFVGNMMFAGVYYSTQRLCKARMANDVLSRINFWGWQTVILGAIITLPLGLTRGKEYAELIWPINILVVLVWVVFAVNFFWTLHKRNEPHLYVALWFYIATIITVAMLYIVNHLSLPTSLTHSYPIFGGVQDALVQWWYGHNAVAFFLTTPILGIMYYFMPKAAGRPVYSYRLSIIHFWALVFIYIWAGPHHLLNTALPQWLQMLGMLFSLMLWAPSWGGMLNGLLTLRGAWDKLRTDPVIKFFAAGVTFYGMATFEGPLMAIRSVNEISHYTDWTIGHVHSGTLGWNGFMAAGMFYWMAPRLWGKKDGSPSKLWSTSMANTHFWLGTVGILLYIGSMWASGILQALMLSATNEAGTQLKYTDFLETVQSILPMLWFRTAGGLLYLTGFILCAINIFMTIKNGKAVNGTKEVVLPEADEMDTKAGWKAVFRNDPVTYSFWVIVFLTLWIFLPSYADVAALAIALGLAAQACWLFKKRHQEWSNLYETLEKNWVPFTLLVVVAAGLGGAIQIIPTVLANKGATVEERVQKLYTPLELAGRDIYITEGCYNCHSQMIRTLETDVRRYGDWSRIGESIYNHPFQWGSKRTGPDLAREGGLRPDKWHYDHMLDPRAISEGSIMPAYPWLLKKETDIDALPSKIGALRDLGVPYPALNKHEILDSAQHQALKISKGLVASNVTLPDDLDESFTAGSISENELVQQLAEREIIALIAYLQKIGAHIDLEVDESAAPKLLNPDTKQQPRVANQ